MVMGSLPHELSARSDGCTYPRCDCIIQMDHGACLRASAGSQEPAPADARIGADGPAARASGERRKKIAESRGDGAPPARDERSWTIWPVGFPPHHSWSIVQTAGEKLGPGESVEVVPRSELVRVQEALDQARALLREVWDFPPEPSFGWGALSDAEELQLAEHEDRHEALEKRVQAALAAGVTEKGETE